MNKTTGEFRFLIFLRDVVIDMVIVFILVTLIQRYVFAPFRVNGPSMCDTFNVYNEECYNGDGEYIITTKISKIVRGDVVVFQAPEGEEGEYFIKRIIGLPGDTIKVSGGFVYLKNEVDDYELLEETYLNEDNYGQTFPYKLSEQIFEVPEGEYLAFGDNRKRSSDSRRCFSQVGCTAENSPFLDEDLMQGEVKLVIFPISHFRLIREVDYSI
jgi:signal peptidase I